MANLPCCILSNFPYRSASVSLLSSIWSIAYYLIPSTWLAFLGSLLWWESVNIRMFPLFYITNAMPALLF
jgi:hypothetical protein